MLFRSFEIVGEKDGGILLDAEVMAILRQAYGDAAPLWSQRWRMFWMACAELFGYDGGREWMVAHYRFAKGAA